MEFEYYPDLEIEEGHNKGASFWIMPIKMVKPDYKCKKGEQEYCDGIVEHRASEISIEESNIESFLWEFFLRHFNHDLTMNYRVLDGDTEYKDFEWNLTLNIYSYNDIRNLLADIQEKIPLMRENLNSSILEPFVKHFPQPPCTAIIGRQLIPLNRTAEEIHAYRLEHLGLFIDFYERFCKRMEKMLQDNPTYNHISVMGP